jgi:hypothetical protein
MYRVKLRINSNWLGTLGVLICVLLLLVTTQIARTANHARANVSEHVSVNAAAASESQYYLSEAAVSANEALSTCAEGYHFASLWEILVVDP